MGDLDLRFYLSILLRRAPYFLATAAAVVVTVAIVSFFLPEVYRASSKIMVEAPQIPTELARSTVPTTALEQLQIVQEQASTTDNLVALARKLNVYGSDIAGISDTDIAKDMRSRISYEQVSPPAQEVTVVEISFDAADPTLAANVANEIVSFILGKNARQRTDRAGDTTQFFEGEVERLKAELANIEADLLKFKTDNKDTLPDSLEFRRTQQAAQQERLMLLEREEAELRSRRNNLVRTYETTGIITKSGPVTPEQQMLQDLNRALSDQLAIFSEDSPNIQALRKRIAAVQESLRDRQANSQDSDGKQAMSELDFQLADIDDRLHYIAQQKPIITKNLADLSQTIAATPGNETLLSALERNRQNVQTQYNTAVARLAEASTGQEIEMRSKGVRFSILEPATPPEYRLSPNRRRIVAAGGLGAIGLGLGIVVLLELLNKTIRRPVELTQTLQIQPLATIPYIVGPGELRTGRLRRRLAGLVGLGASTVISLILAHAAIAGLSPDLMPRALDLVRLG